MKIMVIAPHPDDETLGAGGTILRHIDEGQPVTWLLVTKARVEDGFDEALIARRDEVKTRVASAYGFADVIDLELPASGLERCGEKELVDALARAIAKTGAEVIYLPSPSDAHSDHRATFHAAVSATKIFRQPKVKRLLTMEILSETNFGLDPSTLPFRANHYVDISTTLERKLKILELYRSELGEPPFPRSFESVKALARLRGDEAGTMAAEGFMVVKEIR